MPRFPRLAALLAMMALLGAAGCAPPVQEANTVQPAGSPICEADCGSSYSEFPALIAAPSLAPGNPAGTALLAELTIDQAQSVSSITLDLYDADGHVGGSGTLTYDGSNRWSGTVQLASGAPAGSYTPDIIINIGIYEQDPEVFQTLYLYDPLSSDQYYLVANNRIVYEPGRVTLHLARTAVSTIPLSGVILGGN